MDEIAQGILSKHTPELIETFSKATIGVAGCGGLGSNCAIALARCGIGKLIIADFDKLEPSNLNRQQFRLDQLGQPKALALKDNIEAVSPIPEVVAHDVILTAHNIPQIFDGCDIIVEAFDKADQKTMIIETVTAKMPDVWIVAASGIAGIGYLDALAVKKYGKLVIVGDNKTEPGDGVPLLAPRVTIAANMQADLVLQILTGIIT